MRKGWKYTDEEKRAVLNQVDAMIADGVPRLKAYRNAGVSDVTYYAYRRKFGGGLRLVDGPRKEEPVTGMQFSVVNADEAARWIVGNYNSRFSAMTDALCLQLAGLRKSEALSFQVPEKADNKEIQNIITSAKRAVKIARLPWKMRYARKKNVIVALHESRFEQNGKENV